METSVSAQLYVMTPDSLCCTGKDNRPQNQHRLKEDDSKKDNVNNMSAIVGIHIP